MTKNTTKKLQELNRLKQEAEALNEMIEIEKQLIEQRENIKKLREQTAIKCIKCSSKNTGKMGYAYNKYGRVQRYVCKNDACDKNTFMITEDYSSKKWSKK